MSAEEEKEVSIRFAQQESRYRIRDRGKIWVPGEGLCSEMSRVYDQGRGSYGLERLTSSVTYGVPVKVGRVERKNHSAIKVIYQRGGK